MGIVARLLLAAGAILAFAEGLLLAKNRRRQGPPVTTGIGGIVLQNSVDDGREATNESKS
jgi:hypothetical protein